MLLALEFIARRVGDVYDNLRLRISHHLRYIRESGSICRYLSIYPSPSNASSEASQLVGE
ncbi:hypothetical protein [Nostoc sp.]|uniref:hypothetical protein n=1 Tax=Nostoc sp. TaxID=1180 RepID=UPI002A5BD437|nr:hypothetical protein [Nostoc sp. S13]